MNNHTSIPYQITKFVQELAPLYHCGSGGYMTFGWHCDRWTERAWTLQALYMRANSYESLEDVKADLRFCPSLFYGFHLELVCDSDF